MLYKYEYNQLIVFRIFISFLYLDARLFGKTWVAYIPVLPEPVVPVVELEDEGNADGDTSKEEPVSPDQPDSDIPMIDLDLEDEVKKEDQVSPDQPDSDIPMVDLEAEVKKDEPVSPAPDPETAPSSPQPEPETEMVSMPAPTVPKATDKPKKKRKNKKKRSKK